MRPNVPLLIFCLIPFLIGLKAHFWLHFASQKMGHFYVPMSQCPIPCPICGTFILMSQCPRFRR
nr:MAG TPA: restriction alleviation protein [Caudoviricetes sp.]